MTHLLAIDIGSTYTKGARFELVGDRLELRARTRTPTTVAHLKRGFDVVRERLDPDGSVQVSFSSSARGGLAIAALGLVPELTLKIARQAALSAGGKVASVHAYKLVPEDLDALARTRPDILLLAGGTDGGNEVSVRHNAELLAGLPERLNPAALPQAELPAVIYAGNAVPRADVTARLRAAGFEVSEAPNLMPTMEDVNPEGARERIREVFLRRIVHGKGLDQIVAQVGAEPLPTPLAVLRLVEAIHAEAPAFGDFLLVDMGGATTDVYSAGENPEREQRVVLRGVRDPLVKRSVEGDLGLRVSAGVAASATREHLRHTLGEARLDAFQAWLDRLAPEHLPEAGSDGDAFDRALASACVHHAILRHAGTWRRVFTAAGETFLQSGKDLRHVRKVVGSGGYLSAIRDFAPERALLPERSEILPLIPETFTYYRDTDYLWPLLGCLVERWRGPAVACALACLEEAGVSRLIPVHS